MKFNIQTIMNKIKTLLFYKEILITENTIICVPKKEYKRFSEEYMMNKPVNDKIVKLEISGKKIKYKNLENKNEIKEYLKDSEFID